MWGSGFKSLGLAMGGCHGECDNERPDPGVCVTPGFVQGLSVMGLSCLDSMGWGLT